MSKVCEENSLGASTTRTQVIHSTEDLHSSHSSLFTCDDLHGSCGEQSGPHWFTKRSGNGTEIWRVPLRVQRPLGLAGSSRLLSLEGRSSRSRIISTSVRRSCLRGMHYMASASRMSADIDRWVTFQHFAVPRRVGSRGWSEKGEGRPCARGSEIVKGKGREKERERNGGDFQHAPQPLVSSPPELKKGDRARHMPGERERVPVVLLRVWVYGPAINAWRILVRAYVRTCERACVRTLPAITASCTGGVGHRRLYERQSDLGNLMRNWTAVDTRLKGAVLLCILAFIALRWYACRRQSNIIR